MSYFRAPGDAAVLRGLGDLATFPDFDGVDAKWAGVDAALDRLVALVLGVAEYVIEERQVWPAEPAGAGPCVSEWDAGTRDALAGLSDEDLPSVTAAWMRGEELDDSADVEVWQRWVAALVGVARAARDSGESLYCSIA
ncbi:hypothetical protein [Actinokineospora terrae]|uniref:DUF1877 domain-containing protein n=1 Tax=Actinokineospora terrae TaxID=155974 RepID=A0A1H9XJ30_9PSEU|nr:hypothetical protein [Actinokineospora terrae]SES45817.1 hypothetical protein SAMN04487818_115157 [Actinokineospora terrae]